ncbi:MAG TPA: DUF3306 domain-containing protein [Pseudolabrys sp.]|nr:DUF3306 domain-containing protein [Pseudolabrys sp.]
MNDPDNFLSRWSRRKREADESKDKEEKASEARAEPAPENESVRPDSAPDAPSSKLDVESLPPIETISAETDITAFMRAGVPETLKHAALRRAWSADPAIRDFMGPTENYWDAAGPDGIPGFGDLDPNLDVRRMVSELFGETPHQDTPPESETDRVANSPAPPIQNRAEVTEVPQVSPTSPENVPQRDENAAVQTESPEAAPEKKISRRHGGAMPQ